MHGLKWPIISAGKPAEAQACATKAAALRNKVLAQMWDTKTNRFCDGICTDTKVSGHSGIYSDMYPLWMNLVPEVRGEIIGHL